jgi:SAM-dependent methyltransferase
MDVDYEADSTRDQYLALHYPDGDPLEPFLGAGAPPLRERHPYAARGWWERRPEDLALDVGCACGRTTLDLARDHRHAFGLDRSSALVRAAEGVRRTGRARYRTVVEGDLAREHDVAVDAPPNATFLAGDALALPFPDGAFATVAALNLLDRVPDPARALRELARVVAPGGLLLVGSPWTWLDRFTPKELRLGGFEGARGPVRGAEEVRRRLAPGFRLEREGHLPFFLLHHARSGQLGLAHLSTFRRTS